MSQANLDRLFTSVRDLRHALAEESLSNAQRWADAVHRALGDMADAIQDAIERAERTMANLGDINPDFQNAPVTERHVALTRDKWIELGEKVHALRAEIRHQPPRQPLDLVKLRLRAAEIADAVAKVREADDRFLLDTFNSNLGAGE
jgi:hypothetical protein